LNFISKWDRLTDTSVTLLYLQNQEITIYAIWLFDFRRKSKRFSGLRNLLQEFRFWISKFGPKIGKWFISEMNRYLACSFLLSFHCVSSVFYLCFFLPLMPSFYRVSRQWRAWCRSLHQVYTSGSVRWWSKGFPFSSISSYCRLTRIL
jgi:hypothetical protein